MCVCVWLVPNASSSCCPRVQPQSQSQRPVSQQSVIYNTCYTNGCKTSIKRMKNGLFTCNFQFMPHSIIHFLVWVAQWSRGIVAQMTSKYIAFSIYRWARFCVAKSKAKEERNCAQLDGHNSTMQRNAAQWWWWHLWMRIPISGLNETANKPLWCHNLWLSLNVL